MAWIHLRWLILVAGICPLAYYILATYCAWDYFRRTRNAPPPDRSFAPAVSILKPVRGCDREAYENFASFCRQDYPEYEIIFAVSDTQDPVISVIRQLQQDFPDRQIQLVTDIPRVGTNRKVNKLCALTREARYDTLVISDSDVRVEPDYLWEATAALADPRTGLVTTLFRGKTGGGYSAELDALGVPADAAASALVAMKLEGKMKFAFGWTLATTKQHLAEIGGFESIANHHSDDFELGNRISAEGYAVKLMRKPVWMVFPEGTLRDLFQHELRWSIGLRNVRRMGYFGLVLTFGLPWSLLAAFMAPSTILGAGYIFAYLALRLLMAWTVGAWGIGDPVTRRSIWLVPVRDALNTVVWIGGLFSNTVNWRGSLYRVKGGMLVPLPEGEN